MKKSLKIIPWAGWLFFIPVIFLYVNFQNVKKQRDLLLQENLVLLERMTVFEEYAAVFPLWDKIGSLRPKRPIQEVKDITYSVIRHTDPIAGIDPDIILSLMYVESGFNPQARGAAGEWGLMQIMPFWCERYDISCYQLANIDTNIQVGVDILRKNFVACNGNMTCALNKYNGCYPRTEYSERVYSALRRIQ